MRSAAVIRARVCLDSRRNWSATDRMTAVYGSRGRPLGFRSFGSSGPFGRVRVAPATERRRLALRDAPDRRTPRQAVDEGDRRTRAAARLVLAIDGRVTSIVDNL